MAGDRRERARRTARRFLGSTADAGALALAWGTAAGLALEGVRAGSAVHPHWMGTTGSPPLDATIAGIFAALVIAGSGLARLAPRGARIAHATAGVAVAALSAVALARHAAALADGSIAAAGFAPPASLVALALVVRRVVRGVEAPAAAGAARRLFRGAAGVALAGTVLVATQIAAVGATDYRARADAVVVLGSRVYADGRPSGSLVDRTRTACALWRDGLAPTIVLSGGRGGDAPRSEPDAMREIARAEGVPDEALILDEDGRDTEATIRFAARLARQRGWRRVLVVSHDYHLARVRLLAAREGLVVRTVPAVEASPRGWKSAAFPREVAAYAAAWSLGSR